jgi:hypothetical protein
MKVEKWYFFVQIYISSKILLQIESNKKPALFKMLFLIFVSSCEEYEVIKFSISVNVSRYNKKVGFLRNDCHDDVLYHLHTHNRGFSFTKHSLYRRRSGHICENAEREGQCSVKRSHKWSITVSDRISHHVEKCVPTISYCKFRPGVGNWFVINIRKDF